jgi:hypothetical protein
MAGEPAAPSEGERSPTENAGTSPQARQEPGGENRGERTARSAAGEPEASNQETRPSSADSGEPTETGQQPGGGRTGERPATAEANQARSPNQPGQRPQQGGAERDTAEAGGEPRQGNSRDGQRGGPARSLLDQFLDGLGGGPTGPITGEDFAPWADRLREVEEMVGQPELRTEIARARERARQLRQEFRRNQQRPDWAVVRLEVVRPLVEVRERIGEELARRDPGDKLVPIDRDPVPSRYSELVRRYYEELGKDR